MMLNSAGDPKPVLPARFTQPLSKPSSITTSTRPCSLWQHRSHLGGPDSSGGATPTTISTGTSTRTSWKVDAAAVSCFRCCPPCSTPHVSCAGGELLVADNPPIENGYQGPLPTFRSVISIPPVVNRLVLFSLGILHRIIPLEGERYSVAVNILEQSPLTTTTAEPPA